MPKPTLQTLFDAVVREKGARTALLYDDAIYSYEQLSTKADQLAGWMHSEGLQQGDVIGILSTKEFEDFALMVACLKSGITYTNIDIDNPVARIKDICRTCTPKYLFCGEKLTGLDNLSGIGCVRYKDISQNCTPDYPAIDPETVAYIMFTSGSTGKPKGAAITQANLVNFVSWSSARYKIQPADNFANISPLYFDNSVFDFFTAFFNGASLTPIRKELLNKPLELVDHIDRHGCTIWFSVPSMLIYLMMMKVLTADSLRNVRIFTFGGEGFPKTELKKLFELYSDRAEFINVYGPTECTCICSSHTIGKVDFDKLDELPSLGTINDDFRYILDNGELCLIGPNVGKGYFNDEQLSAEVFSMHGDQPMYRTGDLVEERGGLLYFKGRVDNQIKHMGYRIELEEIEIALNALPEIRQSAVIYLRDHAAFGKIVAFLVPENEPPDIVAIKSALKLKLPVYMQPNRFELREFFPKNANGKIDRKQLQTDL
ncbi:MAG: AMP-binding protein [Gammaproteobacteria bacterium]|nr:AMP-binding protein [Gammaproteobacteria bacterium]